MKLRIAVRTPGKPAFELEVERPRVRIGRAASCEVRLDDVKVSARHAELVARYEGLALRDLNSTNGVYVNGQRSTDVPVRPGDSIRVGDSVLLIMTVEGVRVDDPLNKTAPDFETILDRFSIQVSLDDVEGQNPTAGRSLEGDLLRRKLLVLARLGKDLALVGDAASKTVQLATLIREVVGPERLALLERRGDGFEPIAAFDWRYPDPDRPVYVPDAFLRQAAAKSRALLSLDLVSDPQYKDDPGIRRAAAHAAMAAPLLVGDELRGAVYVDRAAPELPFTSEDLHILAVIANQAAIILENARLYGDLRRSEETLAEQNRTLAATIEKLRLAQAEVLQAAKLASIGELVAGITHELNNPLAGILGFAELLASDVSVPPDAAEIADTMRREAGRMRSIVQNLQSFARRDARTRQRMDLNAAVRAAVDLLRAEIVRGGVSVELDLAETAPVEGNLNELEQVLVNIVHNAVQALEERPDPRIRIATRVDGDVVRAVVQDSGPGIPPDHLLRIFDPFFTTKPVGVGTGLGLSVSYGIVTSHGGRLSARNEPGAGAALEIELPRGEAPSPASEPAAPPIPAGVPSRRVLAVDDEPAIRDFIGRLMRQVGHRATVTGDPREAYEAAVAGDFDVILADIRMPTMDGEELYRQIVARRPELGSRFLFVTGSTAGGGHSEFLRRHGASVVAKPFEVAELLRRVEEVARGPSGVPPMG